MTVCRKLNSLQMAPPSHVDLESHLTSMFVEQSEPGSRAEIQRSGVSEKGEVEGAGVREKETELVWKQT